MMGPPERARKSGGRDTSRIFSSVDGNPLSDVTILQDRTRLLAIMKAGQFHKEPARDSPLLLTRDET